jgi:hypothetical protein
MKLCAASALALFVCGCAATSQVPGLAAEGQDAGEIRGIGGTVLSFLLTPLPMPGVISREVKIFKVNGVKVNAMGATYLVRLIPGKYQLTISCVTVAGGRFISGYAEVPLEVVAGHIYQLDASAPCNATATDVTDALSKG